MNIPSDVFHHFQDLVPNANRERIDVAAIVLTGIDYQVTNSLVTPLTIQGAFLAQAVFSNPAYNNPGFAYAQDELLRFESHSIGLAAYHPALLVFARAIPNRSSIHAWMKHIVIFLTPGPAGIADGTVRLCFGMG